MNPSQVNQETAAAKAQGATLQNQYNKQSGQLQGQYSNLSQNALGAQRNLENYTKSMANPEDLYNTALTSAQQMYGFDPKQLLQANQNLARTNTTIANLPQAIQQQGNYYGTTAGSEASNYVNMAGNLTGVQAGQANTANAFQNVLAATQQQANQAAGFGLQGQQLTSQNLQAASQAANSQMATAGQTMAQIEQLQQQQGFITAQQVAAYRNAYSQYVSAQAASTQAAAAMKLANSQVAQIQQAMALKQSAISDQKTLAAATKNQDVRQAQAAAAAADAAQQAATKNSQALNQTPGQYFSNSGQSIIPSYFRTLF